MAGYTDNKQNHQRRLRRVEGQVRGLQRTSDAIARLVRS
jgi:DNA-binding FrmR family transcriptional regulator